MGDDSGRRRMRFSATGWLMVASLILGGAAPACGEDEGPPGASGARTAVKFLRHNNAAYRRADNEAFAAYMATNPGVLIDDVTVDYWSLVSSLNGDLKHNQFKYDLVLVPPSQICSFAANITDVPPQVITLTEAEQKFFPAPLAGAICDGKLKGLPVEYNLEYGGVVVNLERWAARFPDRSPGWTDWPAFIKDAAALTEYDAVTGKPCASGLDIDPDWPEPVRHIFISQILQRGGTYWSPSGLFDFETQAARDALADMVAWVNVDKVMVPGLVPSANTYVTSRLAKGAPGFGCGDVERPLSVMGYMGTWGVNNTADQLPAGSKTRFEFFPLPPMVGGEHRFVQNSGWAFAVPNTSSNPALAWDVARSMALDAAVMRRWSATTGSLPALRENGTAEAARNDPVLAKVQPMLALGQWFGYVPAGAIESVLGAMMTNYFAAVAGEKTVDKALADMQLIANHALSMHR